MEETKQDVPRDLGPQPVDQLLEELALTNRDLVAASPEQLTHKQVQRARKGRRLTRNMQQKVRKALLAAVAAQGIERNVEREELFNYRP
ncbi:MAG: hypothetical protein P1U87_14805 [Verrucomicrobiales bacterium]|nr:hypothetical protein [Verrucomicrobiales bacterium]